MSEAESEEESEEEIPTFEGQVIFKGDFDEEDEPTRGSDEE